MHQEPHQDAGHSHQNGVVVHALQAWGGRRDGKREGWEGEKGEKQEGREGERKRQRHKRQPERERPRIREKDQETEQ